MNPSNILLIRSTENILYTLFYIIKTLTYIVINSTQKHIFFKVYEQSHILLYRPISTYSIYFILNYMCPHRYC